MDIGRRIRQLRVRNGLTQEELASRCELTKGFVSQLENNLTTPSLPALMDLVEALGTDMSSFFSEEQEQKVVFGEEDYFEDVRENCRILWVVPNAQKNAMEPILLTIQPHQPQHDAPRGGGVRIRAERQRDPGQRRKAVPGEEGRNLLHPRGSRAQPAQRHRGTGPGALDHHAAEFLTSSRMRPRAADERALGTATALQVL